MIRLKMNVLFLLLKFCILPLILCEDKLELFKEDDLRQLFKDEKYVVVLLSETEHCTGKCEILEDVLFSVREDLVEDTGGWVIKSYAPNFSQEMGLDGSSIVFMREGKPLVYNGDGKDEEKILTYFLMNKVSTVHNLTDATFEHETQAGTGATTGDWLVMFTRRQDCASCLKLLPVLEAVSVNLKGRKNTALVEREEAPVTARRFGIKSFPAFALFRLGKLYRYTFSAHDVPHLTSFAEESYRNMKAENVPPPKSPFDDVTEAVSDWLKENPGSFLLSAGGFLLVVALLVLLNRPPPESWTSKSNNKKKKKS